MPMFSFDTGFNEGEIKAKVISQRDEKIAVCRKRKKVCSFLCRIGKKILGS